MPPAWMTSAGAPLGPGAFPLAGILGSAGRAGAGSAAFAGGWAGNWSGNRSTLSAVSGPSACGIGLVGGGGTVTFAGGTVTFAGSAGGGEGSAPVGAGGGGEAGTGGAGGGAGGGGTGGGGGFNAGAEAGVLPPTGSVAPESTQGALLRQSHTQAVRSRAQPAAASSPSPSTVSLVRTANLLCPTGPTDPVSVSSARRGRREGFSGTAALDGSRGDAGTGASEAIASRKAVPILARDAPLAYPDRRGPVPFARPAAEAPMRPCYRPFAAVLLLTPCLVAAADWPQFRGPGGMGTSTEKNLPAAWADDSNVVWKVQLPGPGSSSPIVVGDRVLVTCYSGYGVPGMKGGDLASLRRHLLCFDRAGKLRWQKDVTAAAKDYPFASFQSLHGFASATPASDGKNVYVFFGVGGVLAYDLEGKELWQQSVGTGTNDWGSGSSPVLYKDLVIVNAYVESGSLVALHKDTGKLAWQVKGMEWTWSTPVLVDVAGRKELVVSALRKIHGFDPDKGAELWHCHGIDDYIVPSPVAHDGVVYAVGGRSSTAVAVKAGGRGEVRELWRINKGSNVSSPLYHDGHLYWAHEGGGVVYCVRAKDGTIAYEKRLDPHADKIYASATFGDGKIYYVSREQGVYLVAAGPTFTQIAHNELKADRSVFDSSPAVADGRIYLRSNQYLYAIGK